MDRYEACKNISSRLVKYNINLEFCSKAVFAANYKKLTGLSLKEVNRILTSINRKYPIIWYHTKGFIFSYELKSKLNKYLGDFDIDWGTYYSLFHLDYNKEFLTSGGNYAGFNAIHPNIYHKEPVSPKSAIYDIKICLPYEIRVSNYDQLIQNGGIASFIDQVLTCVQTNDGNGLIGRFDGKAYNTCKYCGTFLTLDKRQCEKCNDDDYDNDEDEDDDDE
jgi:hypothetical protein